MPSSVFDRVLITGGTGFIGRYVLDRLVDFGIRPLVTIRKDPAVVPDQVDLLETDLTDTAKVTEIVNTYRPQAAIHLAGVTGSQDTSGRLCHEVNVTATKGLLAALERAGCDRVVMIGSAAEYGSQSTPFQEDMEPMPVSHYGRSKAEATAAALGMNKASGFPVTVLRVFTAYGLGQPGKMFLSRAISCALRGQPFEMTPGSQRRDHVFVADVADAVIKTLGNDEAIGKIINIGTGNAVRLSELAEAVWERCGADRGMLTVGNASQDADSKFDTEADITLAKTLLNWSPRTQLLSGSRNDDGLDLMIRRMRETMI